MTKEEINGYSYRLTQASKTEIIVIMYDIAAAYIKDAVSESDTASDSFIYSIKKAKRVIDELIRALDMKYEISGNLFVLYTYINKILMKCIAGKTAYKLDEATRIISSLRKAFKEVSKADTSGPQMSNTQQVYAGLTYSNGRLDETYDYEVRRGYTV